MSNKPVQAAIDGWFTLNADTPHLIGACCDHCGTYYFPKTLKFCKNPACDSSEFSEVELSRSGKIWSYTNACYKPPEPFVADEPFVPYAIAAVELEKEKMIILGQVVKGVDVDQLKVGQSAELVLETLHEDEDAIKVTWKWQPVR
ncbi:Zn-ribbon domain-containing OB-fold protein [Zhongshania sp.]|uniref:Zn-ribbon domain-containing OB-fold protein n=2 Tax=Zhongshania sp. TaxID=1971902 RepID=UPI003569806F